MTLSQRKVSVLTCSCHSIAWGTATVCDAELHHEVVAWSALAELIMCSVTLLLDKLPLFAHLDTQTNTHTHTHKYGR